MRECVRTRPKSACSGRRRIRKASDGRGQGGRLYAYLFISDVYGDSMNTGFITNSILLGTGLAMDAFSVSVANGLAEPSMKKHRMLAIAGVYAFFQFLMPMTGWVLVHTLTTIFTVVTPFIPWIALALLVWIGGGMIRDTAQENRHLSQLCPALTEKTACAGPDEGGICPRTGQACPDCSAEEAAGGEERRIGAGKLLLQGIATSIDALSVGFTIAGYEGEEAFVCSLIIAAVTLCICLAGLLFGRRFGKRLASRAGYVGGIILIGIGLEIVIRALAGR